VATGAGLREDAVMTDQQQQAQDPVPGVVVTGEPADQQATESVASPAKVMRIAAPYRVRSAAASPWRPTRRLRLEM
jgi:hypothetical protein